MPGIETFDELVGKTIIKVDDTPQDEFMLFYKRITFSDGTSMAIHSSCCWSDGRKMIDVER